MKTKTYTMYIDGKLVLACDKYEEIMWQLEMFLSKWTDRKLKSKRVDIYENGELLTFKPMGKIDFQPAE